MSKDSIERLIFNAVIGSPFSITKNKLDKILKISELASLSETLMLYFIKTAVDQNLFVDEWAKKQVQDEEKTIIQTFPNKISAFVSKKNFTSSDLEEFNHYSFTLFWELVVAYNIYKKWDTKYFSELSKTTSLVILLSHNQLVRKFGDVVSKRILNEKENVAELIIESKLITNYRNIKVYIPDRLSKTQIKEIILDYALISKNPNLNYLRALLLNKNAGKLDLSVKDKYLIKKRCEELESLIMESNEYVYSSNIKVQFCLKQTEKSKVSFNQDTGELLFSYSHKWILDHLDYNTIIANFKTLFGFVDNQFRIVLTNKTSQKSTLEKYLFPNYKNSFAPSHSFDTFLSLGKMQIGGYYEILKAKGIYIEDVLKSFYEDALKKLFSIEGFLLHMPSYEASYLEKCRMILPEIDNLLKQFNYFIEDGSVNQELIQMDSNPIGIDDVRSLIKNKYFVANEKSPNLHGAIYFLFSDQCLLHYVERVNKSYKSFFSLIVNEVINKSDYEDIPIANEYLNRLFDYGLITAEANGQLNATIKAKILFDLYENEVICFWYNTDEEKKVIEQLWKEGFISMENYTKPKSWTVKY